MSKLGGAVAEGAELIEHLYMSFYQELQKPLMDDHNSKASSDASTHGQTHQAAAISSRNDAVAKVMLQHLVKSPICFSWFQYCFTGRYVDPCLYQAGWRQRVLEAVSYRQDLKATDVIYCRFAHNHSRHAIDNCSSTLGLSELKNIASQTMCWWNNV